MSKVNYEYKKEQFERTLRECSMLYTGRRKPMTESLMCFGWECGEGWYDILSELSYNLEELNLRFYDKYRLRIEATQVKEKFGTLRFYYNVMHDTSWLGFILAYPFNRLDSLISNNVKFNYETVIDKEAYVTIERREITEEDANKYEKREFLDEKLVKGDDGKWYIEYPLHHGARTHRELRNHRILEKIRIAARMASWRIESLFNFSNHKTATIAEYMRIQADRYIGDAYRKCFDVCELCGARIGTKDSQRVETEGYIRFICKECDRRENYIYKNHEVSYVKETYGTKYLGNGLFEKFNANAIKFSELENSDKYVPQSEYEKLYNDMDKIYEDYSKNRKAIDGNAKK